MVSQHHVTVRTPVLCPSWLHATTWPPEQRISFACGDGRQRFPVFPHVGVCHWRGTERHGLESVSRPSRTSLTEGRFNLAQDGSLAWMSLWRLIPHRPRPPPSPPSPLSAPLLTATLADLNRVLYDLQVRRMWCLRVQAVRLCYNLYVRNRQEETILKMETRL